jgi:hypothetical protein
MTTLYQQDVVAWARRQAALLRAGRRRSDMRLTPPQSLG